MMFNPYSLEGKVILVTGASSGIGKATAIVCSRLGAAIVLTARNEERLLETYNSLDGEGHVILNGDITNSEDLNKLVVSSPILDGCVLCAGRGLTLPVQFATPDKMDDMFCLNYFAPVELLRLLYKSKKLKKGSSVVALSSLGGTQVFSGCNSIYGASKAALSSFMKFCAKEFSQRVIRVNCICPGMVETPFIHRDNRTDEQLEEDAKRYPLKRYGTPDDIAYMATYLLSDAASWVTGQDFIIDGGISLV